MVRIKVGVRVVSCSLLADLGTSGSFGIADVNLLLHASGLTLLCKHIASVLNQRQLHCESDGLTTTLPSWSIESIIQKQTKVIRH